MSARIDRWLEEAALRLANGTDATRRRFIGGAGAGVLAVAGSRLALDVPEARADSFPGGCFQEYQVNVCYRPYVANQDLHLYKGPDFNAPKIMRKRTGDPDPTPIVIRAGTHVGRQSLRFEKCPVDGGERPDQNGFIWVSGKAVVPGGDCRVTDPALRPQVFENDWPSGWLPWHGGAYSASDPNWPGATCGPCCDFDCRTYSQPSVKCPCFNDCGSGTTTVDAEVHQQHEVVFCPNEELFEGNIPESEFYSLRYMRNSVPIYWLVPGDVVYVHSRITVTNQDPNYIKGNRYCRPNIGEPGWDKYTWFCVHVVCADNAPRRCGGWILSDFLKQRNVPVGECDSTPPQTCVPGSSCVPDGQNCRPG